MAIKALNPFEASWWTPPSQKDDPNPTRFKLKGLDGTQNGYVAPELQIDEHGRVRGISGKGIELALTYGLIDWENFENDKGPVKFNRANFGLIPYDLRVDIALEVLVRSAPDEDARKN